MDYHTLPPISPAPIERVLPAAATKPLSTEILILHVARANYDAARNRADITLSDALSKVEEIDNYKGDTIMLAYHGYDSEHHICPSLQIPLRDIRRDIHYIENSVTLYISNIPQKVADKVRENLCLFINADTVKSVSALDYQAPDQHRKKPKSDYSRLNQ